MRRVKQTTWTTKVTTVLQAEDDFRSLDQLVKATGGKANQINAALHHLRSMRVVDCVVEPDGKGWWFALPPEMDVRLRHVDERTLESEPRRKRKTKKERQA